MCIRDRDYLDGGAGNDKIWAGKGKDTAAYRLSENEGARDRYDGGAGKKDKLLLILTDVEYADPGIQADIDAYLAVLDDSSNKRNKYQFESFDLKVKNFEQLELEIIDTGGSGGPPEDADVVDDIYSGENYDNIPLDRSDPRNPLRIATLEDPLENDSGIFDADGNLLEGVEIQINEDSLPDYISSAVWDDINQNFILEWSELDRDAAEEDATDADGLNFEYEATFEGEVLDTATVSLFLN